MAETPLLELAGVETSYGLSRVLFGISLTVAPGEVISLMGRNGMGKTTTVRSIMGLTPPAAGSIRFAGIEIGGLPAYRIAKLGLGLVPEGRQVFPNLTTRENLVATAADRGGAGDPWTLEKIYALFPRLAARADSMANLLSGGEQQMLAIGRALMTNPRLLILDEATEGLAPLVREEIWRCLDAPARRRAVDPGHRQERRSADPHRRPPLHHRARPRGLGWKLAGARGEHTTSSIAISAFDYGISESSFRRRAGIGNPALAPRYRATSTLERTRPRPIQPSVKVERLRADVQRRGICIVERVSALDEVVHGPFEGLQCVESLTRRSVLKFRKQGFQLPINTIELRLIERRHLTPPLFSPTVSWRFPLAC